MTRLGRISYGMYLIHVFVPAIVRAMLAAVGIASLTLRAWELQPLHAVVTIGLAALSWWLLEGPANGLKSLFPYRQSEKMSLA
jgi:peptidoglycan/LPS O-acetylase OafA/YrhL